MLSRNQSCCSHISVSRKPPLSTGPLPGEKLGAQQELSACGLRRVTSFKAVSICTSPRSARNLRQYTLSAPKGSYSTSKKSGFRWGRDRTSCRSHSWALRASHLPALSPVGRFQGLGRLTAAALKAGVTRI